MIYVKFVCDGCGKGSFSKTVTISSDFRNQLITPFALLPSGWVTRRGTEVIQQFCSASCKTIFELELEKHAPR